MTCFSCHHYRASVFQIENGKSRTAPSYCAKGRGLEFPDIGPKCSAFEYAPGSDEGELAGD